MPEIVLTTLNAKYIHAAFGLRYLFANLGPLESKAEIKEFDINQRALDIVESLLDSNPTIIGFGVYIWNAVQTTQVVGLIKRLRPEVTVILGGPEISYETEAQPLADLSDYVICGEADHKFAEVCRDLLEGRRPERKILTAELPSFANLRLPYRFYDEKDVANRIIYVEASRGCPFSCEFCLSSLDIPVRQVPLPALLHELEQLMDRGVEQFKFVDRTFNLNLSVSSTLLEFFLERHEPGRFYHFEMIPDRLPEGLRDIIAKFPPGSLQFEVGIQTFNPAVAALISRRQDYDRLADNLQFLRKSTGVHVHADLIAGLPGESLESFAQGFDRLIGLGPQEIQVGILKRLRGTPIGRHDTEWEMIYDPNPPYEILRTRLIDFSTMHTLRRFSRYWNLVGNSGNFVETTPLIWTGPDCDPQAAREAPAHSSPFASFLKFTQWLHKRVGRTDSIALVRLTELIFEFLTKDLGHDPTRTARILWRDYQRGGRSDKPGILKNYLSGEFPTESVRRAPLKRQARHSAAGSQGTPKSQVSP